ncbi:unnamed protein product [Mytilus edulis]|uniref:Uncharacterized protein n=1 Tax=Mytilus edulis TaxID=6550 RepID=A0A8S3V6F6_MYTED|nr:unnamed protein product [Mytilus edulis]
MVIQLLNILSVMFRFMSIHRRWGPADFRMERIVDKLAMKEELSDIIKFSINNDWDLQGHDTNLKPSRIKKIVNHLATDEFGSGICLGTDEWGKLALIMKRMESMKKELEKRKKGDKRKIEEGDEEEVQTNKKSKKQKPNPFISDQAGEGTSGGWRQKKKIFFSESSDEGEEEDSDSI